MGVIGGDTLLESGSDVFEMMDLGYEMYFRRSRAEGFPLRSEEKLRRF